MADQDTNNSGAGKTGGTNVGSVIEGNASTGQPPPAKDSATQPMDTASFPSWALWLGLGLAVFIWMWRTGKIAGIRNHILETKEQLDKCTWPTWDELKQHIVVVLISSFLLALFTVIADNVVKEIVWGALLGSDTILFTPPPGP